MRRLAYIAAVILLACTNTTYVGINQPPTWNNQTNRTIIDYIDQRLVGEYYWLDEVVQKSASFNRNRPWENYLSESLLRLETNADDGYLNSRGQRILYSYIDEIKEGTRATTLGFGIELHYTIVVIDSAKGHYGFVVESIFEGSPARAAGIERGDIIISIDGKAITSSNYASLFTAIQGNTASALRLELKRQTTGENLTASLDKGAYDATVVVHSSIHEVEGLKIGYLVYTGFESEYNEAMLEALSTFAAEGVEELVLDLRCNGGGSVSSAIQLCSAMLSAEYEGKTLCTAKRNPKNERYEIVETFALEGTGTALNLKRLTVIGSNYTASASELVIMGLRGLDIPVTLIGSTTQGKNCGMDVTRAKMGSTYLEYAPVTFMCFNAKDFGAWGDGIEADINLKASNAIGVKDDIYPLPRAAWGDAQHDIGLAAAIAHITGKSLEQGERQALATRAAMSNGTMTIDLPQPMQGIRIYHDEGIDALK